MTRPTVRDHSVMRPDSEALFIPGDGARQQSIDCVQCVHCGAHHMVAAALQNLLFGQQKEFGYCPKCDGIFCAPKCQVCVPYERQIENLEAGLHILTPPPLRVAFPAVPPGVLWTPEPEPAAPGVEDSPA